MGWGFRRSLKFGPLKLNFSKSGIGYSVGGRGFRVGQDARGRSYTSASIPGTGLYSRQYSGKGKPPRENSAANVDAGSGADSQPRSGNGGMLFLMFVAGGLLVLLLTHIFSPRPTAPPATPPAAVAAPVAPPPAIPVKRHTHGSRRTSAQGARHRSVKRVSHIQQTQAPLTSDAPPPAN
ncbi:MAG TPA: DUF4236 domain-containing protein [Acidisarcina sp.]|nr:DUF4236 domain-containing protein [Acidisarcina sp.]